MRLFATFAIATIFGTAAFAEEPKVDPGRFSMTPTADGFLRLDTVTGTVSLCVVRNGGAECRAAADDRAALVDEVDRLTHRNAELEARLAAREKALSPLNALPSREDVGKAMDYAEEFMRRMLRLMREPDRERI